MKVYLILKFIKTETLMLVGHSRTIVGYEQFRNGDIRLLIFDPSTPSTNIETFRQNPNGKAHIFRRNLQSFQKPVYQILVIRGLFKDNEKEVKRFLLKFFINILFSIGCKKTSFY